MIFRSGRFHDLVQRQLDLFEEDEDALLAEARAADERWTHASADESEEQYGDYQLVVDSIGTRLHDVREAFAATLDDRTAEDYRSQFDRAARKRFRLLTSFLSDGE